MMHEVDNGEGGMRIHRPGLSVYDPGDPVPREPALATVLDQAHLAIRCLRDALEAATGYHAAAAAQLARARALAGTCTACAMWPSGAVSITAPDAGRPTAPSIVPTPALLSHREVEVLRLLAAGQSNRRIAQALCLSPRTVQRHVANVYLKIGAHCRAEATAYAIDHGLR